MWDSLVERALGMVEAWDADEEIVPLSLVDKVAGPDGLVSVAEAVASTGCPVAPELFCTAT